MRISRCGISFLAFFLLHAVWAAAVSTPLTIKVLSAQTESTSLNSDANGAPIDCSIPDYSAYCHYSRTAIVRHIMVVEDTNGNSFSISCAVDSRWSRCAELLSGETFEARKEKLGIMVWYRDAKGKERKQLFQLVSSVPPSQSAAAAASVPESAQAILSEKVRCNFSSTPSGADIAIDGKYVGNTPSEIGLTAGTHIVVLTMLGFDEWTRDLTVTADSVVNVTASLQKVQP